MSPKNKQNKEQIKVGDFIKYLPTGNVFQIEDIWADSCFGEFESDGATPEEAVANLWLELNKK